MKNKLVLTFIILILLTIASSWIAKSDIAHSERYILPLATLKFLLVGFYFMDMRAAHIFWKILLTGISVLFCSSVLLLIEL